jgi:hypothetical protein
MKKIVRQMKGILIAAFIVSLFGSALYARNYKLQQPAQNSGNYAGYGCCGGAYTNANYDPNYVANYNYPNAASAYDSASPACSGAVSGCYYGAYYADGKNGMIYEKGQRVNDNKGYGYYGGRGRGGWGCH